SRSCDLFFILRSQRRVVLPYLEQMTFENGADKNTTLTVYWAPNSPSPNTVRPLLHHLEAFFSFFSTFCLVFFFSKAFGSNSSGLKFAFHFSFLHSLCSSHFPPSQLISSLFSSLIFLSFSVSHSISSFSLDFFSLFLS